MITVNTAYEEKEATLVIDVSTDKPMTKEEASEYFEYYLCEDILRLYLLRVYDKSETYFDIGVIYYETEEFCSKDLSFENKKQKSAKWEAYLKVEFLAYFDCSSKTYLDRASFKRNYNNGEQR